MAQNVVLSGGELLTEDDGVRIPITAFANLAPQTTYTQTYSTAARTVPAEVAAITGGESPTEAEHNALVADVLALKKVINALIDDLQTVGIIA